MNAERRWTLIRFAIAACALSVVWVLFTATRAPLVLLAGCAGSAVIAALTYDVFIARHQATLRFFVPHPLHLLRYLVLMVILLYAASARVLRAVASGRVNPRIVHFRTSLRSDLARMVLANAVTITPGTLTLDLNDDHLTVHWLFCTTTHSRGAGEIIKGRMERALQRVWA